MNEPDAYVRTDEHQVMRVGQGRVMLDSIVAPFRQGHSPETIRAQYPALSLEEAYGAITYCLAHADQVNQYLQRQDAVWEQQQAQSEKLQGPVVDRLRAARQAAIQGAP